MAEGITYVCSQCSHAIQAWSDGNPYYLDDSGKKHYAYHPDHKNLERCIGNDGPHLCLQCAHEFMVDSRQPISECPDCGAKEIRDVFDLRRQRCPFCKKGIFGIDPERYCIS